MAKSVKKIRKNIPHALCHIQASFNNTIVTFSELSGKTICWASAGQLGFRGSKKSTPFAAQVASQEAGKKALEQGVITVDVKVKGVSPLMQHRFPMPELADMSKGGTKRTGAVDYSEEWREYLYANGKGVYQPATHFESAMISAAVNFKITGKRGKTYKDLLKAAVFVTFLEILKQLNGFL